MSGYCTVDDIKRRAWEGALPQNPDAFGKRTLQQERIEAAIADAKSIIHQIVPYVGGKDFTPTGALKEILKTVSVDIAMYRMVDGVKGSKEARVRYEDAVQRLERIAEQNQRGLEGVNVHRAEVVDVRVAEKGARFRKGALL